MFYMTFCDYWRKFALVLFYLHEDQCKRDAKECSCCCSPTCIKAPGLKRNIFSNMFFMTFCDYLFKFALVLIYYLHEGQCRRDAKECSCCCSPTCIKAPGLKWNIFSNMFFMTFCDYWHKFALVLLYLHEDQCKQDAKECSCCCSPTCIKAPGLKWNIFSNMFFMTFCDYWHKFALVLFYLHEDQCKRDAKECSCCCSPTCIKAPG